MAEKRIHELEGTSVEIIQSERKKKLNNLGKNVRDMWDNKHINMCVMRVPKGE